MQRSHSLRWLALAIGLLATKCIDSISDDCTKTLTCEGVPQPTLNYETCKWEYSDGTVWPDGPSFVNGRWRWPDGKETETQDFRCNLNAADAGIDAGPVGPDCRVNLTCDDGQVCDDTSGTCVECVEDIQCAGNMPMGDAGAAVVCDRASHRCVQCLDNNNCSGDTPVCKVDLANSRRNSCVECLIGDDCDDLAQPICDDRSNDCTSRCESAADCTGDKKACNTARQICVECTDNTTCAANETKKLCDTDSNACVECLDDGQCTESGRVCDPETHSCVECREDAQCQASSNAALRPICNTETKLCVGCLNDLQCTNGGASRCNVVAHECTGCTNSNQCEGGASECNTMTGRCVQCVVNSDCIGVAGKPFCEGVSGECVECLQTSQCTGADAARCDDASHTCVGCLTETDCGGKNLPGLCDTTGLSGVCVDCKGQGPSADCANRGVTGSRCQNGSCTVCVADNDCSLFADAPDNAPVCKENTGCVECVDSGDCVGKLDTPVCKTAAGGGSTPINTCVQCVSNADCQNDAGNSLCQNNTCVPCIADADCNDVDSNGSQPGGIDLNVCDSGTCVQCTGPKNGGCANGTNVCNSVAKTCTQLQVGSAALCDTCVADNHCGPNARCVRLTVGTSSVFSCFPLATGTPPTCAERVYFGLNQGETIDVQQSPPATCLLRQTTCEGYRDYELLSECEGDPDCGVTGVADGICTAGQCTVPCDSSNDCPGVCEAAGFCRL